MTTAKPALFRHRRSPVEAVQYREGLEDAAICRCGGYLEDGLAHPHVHGADGVAKVSDGSWLVREFGQVEVLSDEVFKGNYEPSDGGIPLGAHLTPEEHDAAVELAEKPAGRKRK